MDNHEAPAAKRTRLEMRPAPKSLESQIENCNKVLEVLEDRKKALTVKRRKSENDKYLIGAREVVLENIDTDLAKIERLIEMQLEVKLGLIDYYENFECTRSVISTKLAWLVPFSFSLPNVSSAEHQVVRLRQSHQSDLDHLDLLAIYHFLSLTVPFRRRFQPDSLKRTDKKSHCGRPRLLILTKQIRQYM